MGLGLNVGHLRRALLLGRLWTGKAKGRTGQGPSIDQTVSDAIAKKVQLPVPLMNTGVRFIGDGQPSSWRSAGVKNVPEIDPVRLFNRVFAGGQPCPAPQLDTVKLQRKSVLDFVGRELDNFGKRLGTEDRAKIERPPRIAARHREAAVGARARAAGCSKPAVAAGKLDTPAMMKTMYDLMAAALKCDVTRVATIDIYDDGGGDGNSFGCLGINRDYHAVAHGGGARDKIKIDAWLYSQVANLVKQLDETPEGGGTALDNSRGGRGQRPGGRRQPQGQPDPLHADRQRAAATSRPAAWSQCSSNPHNRLLASICNAMDIPVTGYGAADRQGTLPELSTV